MLENILFQIKKYNAQLVAVSKTKPIELIMPLYTLGQRDFGENRVQELVPKQAEMPADIRWHLIGHLQTNKVKYIAPFVYCIHSVDSVELLETIQEQAAKNSRQIRCLLQLKIAAEETKYGFDESVLKDFLNTFTPEKYPNVIFNGVMGMATFTDDVVQVRQEFAHLKSIFDTLKNQYFAENADFKEISMGMSDDYPIALEEGSTMLRIGSLLFKDL